jgi:hypothetical protein
MKLIKPNCRVQFTAEDVEFITRVLGRGGAKDGCLVELLGDESTRDMLLDDETLLAAMLEWGACLKVSPHLYFYIMVRHALKRAGIPERDVADYVAELLAEFSAQSRIEAPVVGNSKPPEYFFEMVAALGHANDVGRFAIRAHMGNQSLFLTGVFPERIRRRAETRGFPDLHYYEAIGQSSFREASHHRLAERYHLAGVFETLGDRFREARAALNDLAERVFSLNDGTHGVEGLLRRIV